MIYTTFDPDGLFYDCRIASTNNTLTSVSRGCHGGKPQDIQALGDNSQKSQWANYELGPKNIKATTFSAAHGCFIDSEANLFVSDWNQTGRLTKLSKIK